MRIAIVNVPYDCGQHNARTGAGPTYLLERGLIESLRAAGHEVDVTSLRLPPGFHTEWGALRTLQRQIATCVRDAVSRGERVLILSGNCAPAALGALGGLGSASTAMLWMDAHADFNTPETSLSGFLDGMAIAIAVGHCWKKATEDLAAIAESRVMQIGVRDVDPEERARLERSQIVRVARDASSVASALARMRPAVQSVYVHLDLDVLDAAELRANGYASPGGLSADDVAGILTRVGAALPVHVASFTALDPALDPDRAWPIVERLAHVLAALPASA